MRQFVLRQTEFTAAGFDQLPERVRSLGIRQELMCPSPASERRSMIENRGENVEKQNSTFCRATQ